MLRITSSIGLDESEFQESFLRAGGPGGQNVNKVETAVQLRLDVRNSPSLPEWLKERVPAIAGRRMTEDGVLIVTANSFRSQERNREDARARVVAILAKAAERQAPRRATRPTFASKQRRLEQKSGRAVVKRMRGKIEID